MFTRIRELTPRIKRYVTRRARSGQIKSIANQILNEINREKFLRTFNSRYNDKLLNDLDRWMREAVTRVLVHGLDRLPKGACVCDLGCGSGYFMLACKHFGLEAVGVDLDRDPMYNEMIDYLGLERTVHSIEPNGVMPPLPRAPFHAVTAFMTCFNRYSDGRPWELPEWSFFAKDLHSQLVPSGRIIIKFNRNRKTAQAYPPSVRNIYQELSMFKSKVFSDVLDLEAL